MMTRSLHVIASASEAIQSRTRGGLDCFVADAPRNDSSYPRHSGRSRREGTRNLEIPGLVLRTIPE